MKNLMLVTVLLALTSCSTFEKWVPHADFHVGFAGVELGVDTRPVMSAVAGGVTAVGGVVTGLGGAATIESNKK